MLFLSFYACAGAQAQQASLVVSPVIAAEPSGGTPAEGDSAAIQSQGNVTLDFKDADIANVLKIISYKSGINIVTTPDVSGNVSVRLSDVPWEIALDVILKTYGFGYQKQGNVILVTRIENVAKIAADEPLRTDIVTLKFLDAQDAQKILIPLLSPRGKISVLYSRGQKGWQFGTFKIGRESAAANAAAIKDGMGSIKPETVSYEKNDKGETVMKKADFDSSIKSKMLVITDTASSLDSIRNIILPKIDIKPKQVLIETKIIEVSRDKLRDIGLDWGLGSKDAATTNAITTQGTGTAIGGHSGTIATSSNPLVPSLFDPATSTILGYQPYNAGGEFIFQKLTGTKFEAVIHALEDDANTNTLSAPSILTLDNQEASMLVGFHTPILQSTVTAGDNSGLGSTITQTLDYYQEIGIRLNVVPQVSEEGYINMIIHPSVTSSSSNVTATSTASGETTETEYPVIDVREAQTQVLLKDQETIVIGGLLKDVKSKEFIGIPFLKDIPWVGRLFGRETTSTQKIDLLIFIKAKIIREGEYTPEELAKLEARLERSPVVVKAKLADRKKDKNNRDVSDPNRRTVP
ncbi:MAG: secretin and TonB N-terminal domain-containing protein, partial [Candidatus Omnitrophica bacterium]|nr:secretin and TonB N-terminal domain-containing protein [Candidatus Omnitrophota bacterium]